jgi:hypothetical protein
MKKQKQKRIREPKPLELCCVREEDYADLIEAGYSPPFSAGTRMVFLGEIKNMPGHGVYAEHFSGKIYSGWHTDNFRVLTEEEI